MATQAALKYGHRGGIIKKLSAAAALTPGDVVVEGERITVVSGTKPIAVGDDYTLQTDGVFEMNALSTDTWSAGDLLYWDDTNNRLTDTAASHKTAGLAAADKASGATKADCDINAAVSDTTVE